MLDQAATVGSVKEPIQLMPQFDHEPQAELTYGDTTYRLPYTLVHSLRRLISVDSHTTHFTDMADLAQVLHGLVNEMGAAADRERG